MKTFKLITNIFMIGVVLAAVTACGQKQSNKATFRRNRVPTTNGTTVAPNQSATTGSNYGILQGYSREDVKNFLGADDNEIGYIAPSNSTDMGVFITGQIVYSGAVISSSNIHIIVRDQGYQQAGGEFQTDFSGCRDAVQTGSNFQITCSDQAGAITMNGYVSGNSFVANSVTFTTSGFSGGSLGSFQMLRNMILY